MTRTYYGRIISFSLLILSLFVVSLSTRADVQYVYDAAGRLVQMVAPDGTTNQYQYDSVGNIIASQPLAVSTISISQFAPSSGDIGTTVTINGSGFNATPTLNTVTFNGVAATVVSATANSIVTTVPTGATSGQITVTNANGTATSSTSFIVGHQLIIDGQPLPVSLAASQSGTFTFFGTAGQSLGLGLTGVATTPSGGTLNVAVTAPGSTTALVSVTTTTTGTGSVALPVLAVTGMYTVTVTANPSTDAATFNLLLTSDATASMSSSGWTRTFAPSRMGQNATYTFSGTVGQNIGLVLSNDTFTGGTTVTVYDPSHSVVTSQVVTYSNTMTPYLVNLANLTTTGTYTMRIVPQNGAVGALTVEMSGGQSGSLVVNGDAVLMSLAAGQTGTLTFSGTAGQDLGLGVTGLVTNSSGGTLTVTVVNPDSTVLGSFNVTGPTGSYALPVLAQTGTYTVTVNPGAVSASFNMLLSSDITGTLTNGSAMMFAPWRMGQYASYTFSGTAGQNLSLILSNDAFPGGTTFIVYGPDNAQLASQTVIFTMPPQPVLMNLASLPATGTYTVRVVPPNGAIGSIDVTLASGSSGSLVLDGAPTSVSLAANQTASYTFSGTAGQHLGLGVDNLLTPANAGVNVTILNPDTSVLASFVTTAHAGSIALPVLVQSGTYTVNIITINSVAAFNLLLSSDATQTLTNGVAANLVIGRMGQAATYTMDGAVGQTINLLLSNDTLAGTTTFTVYDPTGAQIAQTTLTSTGAQSSQLFTLPKLTLAGTYTMRVVPPNGATGMVMTTLTTVATETLTVDTAAMVNLAGSQYGVYTFSGTQGQLLGLGVTGLSTSPAGATLVVSVYDPNNTLMGSFSTSTAIGSMALPLLPLTGNYTVHVMAGLNAASFVLLLSSDATGTLPTDGSALTFAPIQIGQNAAFTINGLIGEGLRLVVSNDSFLGYSYLTVYDPSGAVVRNTSLFSIGSPVGTTLPITTLKSSGIYTVRFTVSNGATGTVSIAQAGVVSGTLNLGTGAPVSLAVGQNGLYTFTGTQGQLLGLGVTGSAPTYVTVLNPDGSVLASYTPANTTAGYALPPLVQTGTYTVVANSSVYSSSFTLTVISDATGTLAIDGPVASFTPTQVGQNAAYTFSGTAGENLSLQFSGDTFSGMTTFYVYDPTGALISTNTLSGTGTATSGDLPIPVLAQTGTYTVRIVPPSKATSGSLSVALTTNVMGTLTPDGAATAVNLAGGQIGRFTFSGTSGQLLGLGVTGLTTSPAAGSVSIGVYNPDHSLLASYSTAAAASGVPLPVLPTTGTYSVIVNPGAAALTMSMLLSSDTTGALPSDGTALTFTPSNVGQNASYSFVAGGQNLTMTMSGDTFVGNTTFMIYGPKGLVSTTTLASDGTASSGTYALPSLGVGPFTVRVVPPSGVLGSVSVSLPTPPTGTLTIDGAATAVTLAASQYGNYTFNGTQGQWLGLGVSGIVTAPSGGALTIYIYNPDGSQFTNFTTSGASGSVTLPVLPQTGTYTVNVNPGTRAATFNLLLSSDATGTLTENGSALTFAPTRMGQAATYTFAATAGQYFSLAISADTFPGYTYFYLYDPTGQLVNAPNTAYAAIGGTLPYNIPMPGYNSTLPLTGNYTLRVAPPNGATGLMSVAVTADAVGTLTVDGAATAVSLQANQSGVYTFTGSKGQLLSLGVTGLATSPSGGSLNINIYAPQGGINMGVISTSGANGSLTLPPLPQTGIYKVYLSTGSLSVPGTKAATFNLLLSSDATGTLTVNGSAQTFAPTRVGQAATYTVTGTAGQYLGLAATGDTFPGYTYFYLYDPTGKQIASKSLSSAGAATAAAWAVPSSTTPLALSGTYSMRVIPPSGASGSVSIAAYSNATGTVAVDGDATAVSLAANQNGTYTFSGTAGQLLGLGVDKLATTPSGGSLQFNIYDPSGAYFTSFNITTLPSFYLPALPKSGTYTIYLSAGSRAATFNLLLSSYASGTLTANGPATIFAPARMGRAATYTFTATAGQYVYLISSDTFPSTTYMTVTDPSGKQVDSAYLYNSSNTTLNQSWLVPASPFSPVALSGTYTVEVKPYNGATGSISLAVTTDATGTVTVDSDATTVSLAANQNGAYTFDGTAGQSLGLGVTGLATSPSGGTLNVNIYSPNGKSLTSFNTSAATGSVTLPTLPLTGTYTVYLSTGSLYTPGSMAATFNLLLSTDVIGTLTEDGAAATFTPTRVGQAATYTVAVTAGQYLNLIASGDTLPGYTYFYLYDPTGKQISSVYLYSGGTTATAKNWPLPYVTTPLALTGNYTLRVVPPSGASGSVSVAVTADVTGTVTVDGTASAFSLAGYQNGMFSFNGTAGQSVSLGVTGITTVPSGGALYVQVFYPNGASMAAFISTVTAGSVTLPVLTQTGTYMVYVSTGSFSGVGSRSATFNMLVSSDATGSLTENGSAVTFTPTRMGQAATYTFAGTAGQYLNLVASGDTFVGYNGYTYIDLYDPNGKRISTVSLYSSGTAIGGVWALPAYNTPLALTGNYTVRVEPPDGASGTISVAVTTDLTGGTLTLDGDATAVSLSAYQNGIYTFSGTAGQLLGIGMTGLTTTPSGGTLSVEIFNPSGSVLTNFHSSSATGSVTLPTLTQTGTYMVYVSTGGNATTGSYAAMFNLLLSSDATGTLTENGPAATFAPTRIGQAATYTFAGTAGDATHLAISGDIIPGYTYVYVYDPTGKQVNSTYIYSSGAASTLSYALSALDATGNFTVRVEPPNGATGSLDIGITSP